MTFICVGRVFDISGRRAFGGWYDVPGSSRTEGSCSSVEVWSWAPRSRCSPPLAAASCLSLVGPLHPWPGLVARIASGAHLFARLPSQ